MEKRMPVLIEVFVLITMLNSNDALCVLWLAVTLCEIHQSCNWFFWLMRNISAIPVGAQAPRSIVWRFTGVLLLYVQCKLISWEILIYTYIYYILIYTYFTSWWFCLNLSVLIFIKMYNLKNKKTLSMKVHPNPNRLWGVNRSYENIRMRLYKFIWFSHQFAKKKKVFCKNCNESVLVQ